MCSNRYIALALLPLACRWVMGGSAPADAVEEDALRLLRDRFASYEVRCRLQLASEARRLRTARLIPFLPCRKSFWILQPSRRFPRCRSIERMSSARRRGSSDGCPPRESRHLRSALLSRPSSTRITRSADAAPPPQNARTMETGAQPIVYGDWLHAGRRRSQSIDFHCRCWNRCKISPGRCTELAQHPALMLSPLYLPAGPDKPTVLLYAHYDVQVVCMPPTLDRLAVAVTCNSIRWAAH